MTEKKFSSWPCLEENVADLKNADRWSWVYASVDFCLEVTFALVSPRFGKTTVAFTGVRSFCVDAISILAFVGHAALVNVCEVKENQ